MSVTFTVRRADGTAIPGREHPASCCLCAQFAPTWNGFGLDGVDRAELAREARPSCTRCQGTGVEAGWSEDLSMNLNQANGRALLALLGLSVVIGGGVTPDEIAPFALAEAQDCAGWMSFPEARRRVMAARARFDRLAPALVRAEAAVYGPPRVREDGVVEARPLRGWTPSFNADELRARLEAFAALIEAGARAGATELFWC